MPASLSITITITLIAIIISGIISITVTIVHNSVISGDISIISPPRGTPLPPRSRNPRLTLRA